MPAVTAEDINGVLHKGNRVPEQTEILLQKEGVSITIVQDAHHLMRLHVQTATAVKIQERAAAEVQEVPLLRRVEAQAEAVVRAVVVLHQADAQVVVEVPQEGVNLNTL